MFSDNAGTLYAQNSQGSASTSTDISSGITVTNNNYYQIAMNLSTDVKFYVNGTLKATHTTNLPNWGDIYTGYGISGSAQRIYTTAPLISMEL